MTTFFDHGVQGGFIYSAPLALVGAPKEAVILAFFIGFLEGSSADWLGDYTQNHSGQPIGPADWLHIKIIDPIFHKYGDNWWGKISLWLKTVVVTVFLTDVTYFLYIISLFWR
jgi:hypothetical protein